MRRGLHSLLLVFSTLALSAATIGCSNTQPAQRLVADPPNATMNAEGRYRNLDARNRDYPHTCEADCYTPHPWVDCEGENERCVFVGDNPDIPTDTGFIVQWLGHASFQIIDPSGQRFLLDPVSRQFDRPVSLAFRIAEGFYREEPQWTSIYDEERVAAVLYSHVHYDHFSKRDIRRLGTTPQYYVGLDTARYFPRGDYHITEMDWFTASSLGDTQIHAVPARHFNSRIWVPFIYEDENRALWTAWIIEHEGKTLFFAGDTGYSSHFKTIHDHFGDIDVCLIPIASYHHETHGAWYRYVHTTPEDALVAAQDLGCKVMVPWGYGNHSWKMGDLTSHSALVRLLNMADRLDNDIPFYIMNEGDVRRF